MPAPRLPPALRPPVPANPAASNRDGVWRVLKAEGLNRRLEPSSERPANGQSTFRDYDLGFVHIDTKHPPKLQTSDGGRCKRHLFAAIDRCSRSVRLAVKHDGAEKSAIAFLRAAAAASLTR